MLLQSMYIRIFSTSAYVTLMLISLKCGSSPIVNNPFPYFSPMEVYDTIRRHDVRGNAQAEAVH